MFDRQAELTKGRNSSTMILRGGLAVGSFQGGKVSNDDLGIESVFGALELSKKSHK